MSARSGYDDGDLAAVLAGLTDPDSEPRAAVAAMIANRPTRDPRVAAVLATLLADTAVVVLEPATLVHGELRLLAAAALAAERIAVADVSPVHVHAAPPVRGVTREEYAALRDAGQLPPPREIVIRAPADWSALAVQGRATPLPAAGRPVRDAATERRDLIAALAPGSGRQVATLRALARTPTGAAEVRDAIEPLLADRSVHALTIPHRYGELRVLAAAALAAERHAAGDPRPIALRSPPLLGSDELAERARGAGLTVHRPASQYVALRDRGDLPDQDWAITHPANLGWT